MVITVVGLGLIGGSFCKAIKEKTEHTCLGIDLSEDVIERAISEKTIDGECKDLSVSDITIVCLYPEATVEFILNNKDKFKKGSIVTDVCGIKEYVVSSVKDAVKECGATFIGAHPMAGREFSGYAYSLSDLYKKSGLENPACIVDTNHSNSGKKYLEQIRISKEVLHSRRYNNDIK